MNVCLAVTGLPSRTRTRSADRLSHTCVLEYVLVGRVVLARRLRQQLQHSARPLPLSRQHGAHPAIKQCPEIINGATQFTCQLSDGKSVTLGRTMIIGPIASKPASPQPPTPRRRRLGQLDSTAGNLPARHTRVHRTLTASAGPRLQRYMSRGLCSCDMSTTASSPTRMVPVP